MSTISLSSFHSVDKLSPSLIVCGTIMDYLDEEPPRYRSTREIVSKFFITENLPLSPEPNYFIFYQSPQVSDPRQADLILFAEKHLDVECEKWNSSLVDKVVRKGSIFLGECLQHKEQGNEITGVVRDSYFKEQQISEAAQAQLSLYGWDNNDDAREDYEAEAEKRAPNKKIMDENGELTTHGLFLVWRFGDGDGFTKWKALAAWEKKSAEEFYQRTLVMISAIKQAIKRRKSDGKIFGVAGHEHLSQTELYEPKKSLAILYQYLKTISVIVLCPTVIEKDLATHSKPLSAEILDAC